MPGFKNCILLLFILITLSCNKIAPQGEENIDRPGQEGPADEAATLRFEPERADIISGAEASGSLEIYLVREGGGLPDTLYNIEAAGAVAPATVHFARGEVRAVVPVHYSVRLVPGGEHRGRVRVGDALFILYIRCPDIARHEGRGIWDDGETLTEAELITRAGMTVTDCAVIAEADTLAMFTLSCDSGVYRPTAYRDETAGIISVGTGMHFVSGRAGREIFRATYSDGWIFGVVSIDGGAPGDPSKHLWKCLMIRDNQTLTAVDLYDQAPGLGALNNAPRPALLTIHTDGVTATVAPQRAPFVNVELFPSGLIIAGAGVVAGNVISIPEPLTDFSGSLAPWKTQHVSRWEW